MENIDEVKSPKIVEQVSKIWMQVELVLNVNII